MSNGTVLVIEDEESIASLVEAYLARAGYAVRWAQTAADGLAALETQPLRLVVLDLGLPDRDGLEVCREIRRRGRMPVVMLTARDEEPDRVAGLEVGADDYVPKPFSPRELVARVKAVLRRSEPDADADSLQLADVTVARDGRVATVAGREVRLTAKEFDLLAHLIENRGRVVGREQLLDRVWGLTYPGGTRTVDVHVSELRRKLDRPALIQTFRGVGYKAVER